MKRFVLLVCVLCIAASAGVAGAYFSTQRLVADNVVRAGNISLAVEPTSSAVNVENLAPGVAEVRRLTVTNDGTLPADISVTNLRRAGITAFYNALECAVFHGETEVYRGLLSEMQTLPVALAPGESAALDFAVLLPAEAPNSFSGDYTRFTLYVNGEQQR